MLLKCVSVFAVWTSVNGVDYNNEVTYRLDNIIYYEPLESTQPPSLNGTGYN